MSVEFITDRHREVFKKLYSKRSWRLHRVSPTTYHRDLEVDLRPIDNGSELAKAMKKGNLFRCRIGRGKYHYATTLLEAMELALKADGEKL